MPKTMTPTEKESPTVAAYTELLRDINQRAKDHKGKAEAYEEMIQADGFDAPELAKKMYRRHREMARVQFDVAQTIMQMNRDFLCDQQDNKSK